MADKDLSMFALDNFVEDTLKQVYDGIKGSGVAAQIAPDGTRLQTYTVHMDLDVKGQRVVLDIPIKVD